MAKRLPFEKWFWKDWMSDTAIGDLSIAAAGAWHNTLGRMWLQDGPDYTLTATLASFGRWWGVTADTAALLVDEFEQTAVCNVLRGGHGHVTLVCRRREREAKSNALNAERQRRYRERHAARNAFETSRNEERSDIRDQRTEIREQTVKKERTVIKGEGPPARLTPLDCGLPSPTVCSSLTRKGKEE